MKKPLIALLGILCLVMFSTASHSQSSLQGYKRAILKYTNDYRESHGLSPLRLSDVAGDLAQEHSKQMARHRVGFGHGGFQNRTNGLKKAYGRNIATGENVAYGKISAKEVVNIWIHSRPHRKNLLGNYNAVGIGVARDQRGLFYFTQLFIRK